MEKMRKVVVHLRFIFIFLLLVLYQTKAQYYSGMPSYAGMSSSGGGSVPSMPDLSGYPGFSSGPPSGEAQHVIPQPPPQIIAQAAPQPLPPQLTQGLTLPQSGVTGGLNRLRNRYSIGSFNSNSLRQLILPAIAMGAAYHFGRTH